jgi:hypothetical protein
MRILAVFPCQSEDWVVLDELVGETELSILADRTVTPSLTHGSGYRLTRIAEAIWRLRSATNCAPFVRTSSSGLGTCSQREAGIAGACSEEFRPTAWSHLSTLAFCLTPVPRHRLLRLCLDFRVIDHVLIARANADTLEHFEDEPPRIVSLDLNRAREIPELLRQRLSQEQKWVLWVHSEVTRCPSMVGLVEIIPRLLAQGWSIRALCYKVQKTDPQIGAVCLPKLPCPYFLEAL